MLECDVWLCDDETGCVALGKVLEVGMLEYFVGKSLGLPPFSRIIPYCLGHLAVFRAVKLWL